MGTIKEYLDSITPESEYIKIWVVDSGRRLARMLCKDRAILRGI